MIVFNISELTNDNCRCRMCNTLSSFTSLSPMKGMKPAAKSSGSGAAAAAAAAVGAAAVATTPAAATKSRKDCPPDVEELGRATWTFLHSLAATYPDVASPAEQKQMSSFLSIFSNVYPCWHCAADFRDWVSKPENKPQLNGKDAFGNWLCIAHNEVNTKLGKPEFDCKTWKNRWVDGWPDGRCD